MQNGLKGEFGVGGVGGGGHGWHTDESRGETLLEERQTKHAAKAKGV